MKNLSFMILNMQDELHKEIKKNKSLTSQEKDLRD